MDLDPNRGSLQCDGGEPEGLGKTVLNPAGQQGSKSEEEGLRKEDMDLNDGYP